MKLMSMSMMTRMMMLVLFEPTNAIDVPKSLKMKRMVRWLNQLDVTDAHAGSTLAVYQR